MKHRIQDIYHAFTSDSGKSTLFNSVAGYRSLTANFPGATVQYTSGRIRFNGLLSELIDLPGIYSLTASNPAETATRDFLLHQFPSALINVIDTSLLSRSLELTLQLLEFQYPMVVCMIGRELSPGTGVGFHRDTERIIDQLISNIGKFPVLDQRLPPRMLAIRLLEDDHQLANQILPSSRGQVESARRQLEINRGKPAEEVIESERHALSMKLFGAVATVSSPPRDVRERLDAVL